VWLKEEEDAVLAIGGTCQKVYLLSVSRLKVFTILKGHTGPVLQVSAHPLRSEILYSLGMNDSVKVWDWRKGICLQSIQLRATVFVSLSGLSLRLEFLSPPFSFKTVHPNGNEFMTGGAEGGITRWAFTPGLPLENKKGKQVKTTVHQSTVDSIAYLDNSRVLSKSINGKIEHWDLETEKVWCALFSAFSIRQVHFNLAPTASDN